MNQTTNAAFKASLEELPLTQLIEVDKVGIEIQGQKLAPEDLTDEHKRIIIEVIQRVRQSAQARRANNTKQAKKLKNPEKQINISDFL